MYRICILSLLLFACKGNNTPENTPTEEPVTEQREQGARQPPRYPIQWHSPDPRWKKCRYHSYLGGK